jgi:hypothetical protein
MAAQAHHATLVDGAEHRQWRRLEPVRPVRHEVRQRRPIDHAEQRLDVVLDEGSRSVHGADRTSARLPFRPRLGASSGRGFV